MNGGDDQINCENTLTPGNQQIVRNPASNLPVDSKFAFVFDLVLCVVVGMLMGYRYRALCERSESVLQD